MANTAMPVKKHLTSHAFHSKHLQSSWVPDAPFPYISAFTGKFMEEMEER
jgi:hypothetical protein